MSRLPGLRSTINLTMPHGVSESAIDVRRAMRQTGLFRPGDPSLRRDIVKAIANEIRDGDDVLEVDEP